MSATVGISGEALRFAVILHENREALEQLALRLARNPDDASDLVQDTFERAVRGRSALKDERSARAWLMSILRNRYFDGRRRKRREVSVDLLPEAPPDDSDGRPWQLLTGDEVRRAILDLPEPFREVAILHDLEGLSHGAIAERTGVARRTIATRLFRAHRRLEIALRHLLEGVNVCA